MTFKYSVRLAVVFAIVVLLSVSANAQSTNIIDIPDSPPIGTFSTVVLTRDSLLVFTDPISQSLNYVQLRSMELHQVAMDACSPGVSFRPSAVYTMLDDRLLVTSHSAPWAAIFSNSGNCDSLVDEDYRPAESVCVVGDRIVGLYIMPTGDTYVAEYTLSGKLVKRHKDVPNTFPQYNMRSDSRGLVCPAGRYLWLSFASGPELIRIDRENSTYDTFLPEMHDSYSTIDQDLPVTSDIRMLMNQSKIISENTHILLWSDVIENGIVRFYFNQGRKEYILNTISLDDSHSIVEASTSVIMNRGYLGLLGGQLVGAVLDTNSKSEYPNPNMILVKW